MKNKNNIRFSIFISSLSLLGSFFLLFGNEKEGKRHLNTAHGLFFLVAVFKGVSSTKNNLETSWRGKISFPNIYSLLGICISSTLFPLKSKEKRKEETSDPNQRVERRTRWLPVSSDLLTFESLRNRLWRLDISSPSRSMCPSGTIDPQRCWPKGIWNRWPTERWDLEHDPHMPTADSICRHMWEATRLKRSTSESILWT